MKPLALLLCLLCLPRLPAQTLDITLHTAFIGDRHQKLTRRAAATVRIRTEKRVNLRFASLDMESLGGQTASATNAPSQIYSLPFLFADYAQVDAQRARYDAELLREHDLALEEGGFAYLLSRQPVRRPEDLATLRIWSMGREHLELGIAVPCPLGEVRQKLEAGEIDAVVMTPALAVALRWHHHLRHQLELPLAYIVRPITLPPSDGSPEDLAVVREAVHELARAHAVASREQENEARSVFAKYGIVPTALTDEERAEWTAWGRRLVDGEMKKLAPEQVRVLERLRAP